jgi:hypothetical protein
MAVGLSGRLHRYAHIKPWSQQPHAGTEAN